MVVVPLPVHGADLSHHNDKLDFVRAQKCGLDWVCLKTTQGLKFVDDTYKPRLAELRKLKMGRMAYHFAETTDPVAQAKHFLAHADIKPGDMRPMLDLEDTKGSSFSKMTIKARTEWVRKFVDVVFKATGVKPFIYTPFDLLEHFDCPLWVARYSNKNADPKIPAPWKTYTIRQFSNGEFGVPHSFPGLGNVDLNCWHGDPKRLLQVFTIPQPPVKKPPVKKPPVKKPPVKKPPAKRTSATLNVGTGNIQNFGPNLTPKQVEADLKVVGANVDLGLLQEIGEAADHDAVKRVLGPLFHVTETTRECVNVGRKSLLVPVGPPSVTKIADGLKNTPTKKYHSPPRYMTEQRYTWAVPTDLPDAVVLNIHYVQQAWPADPSKIELVEERRALWNSGHKVHGARALTLREAGFIVFGGGDWNRGGLGIPLFANDQIWVCGGERGLDHVYALVPKGVKLRLPTKFRTLKINSDHDVKVNGVVLEKA